MLQRRSVVIDGIMLKVVYYPEGDPLNIKVKDSHLLKTKKQISEALDKILSYEKPMSEMRAAGYNRTKASMLNEWAAHNVLYNMGYKEDHTKDVDMESPESFWHKIGYWILSWFFKSK